MDHLGFIAAVYGTTFVVIVALVVAIWQAKLLTRTNLGLNSAHFVR